MEQVIGWAVLRVDVVVKGSAFEEHPQRQQQVAFVVVGGERAEELLVGRKPRGDQDNDHHQAEQRAAGRLRAFQPLADLQPHPSHVVHEDLSRAMAGGFSRELTRTVRTSSCHSATVAASSRSGFSRGSSATKFTRRATMNDGLPRT